MPNKNYISGYSLERYCNLTLSYNGYHTKRNALSYGVEDIIAFNGKQMLLVQVKNSKTLGHRAMSREEQEILRRHAREINAIPIYLYWENKKKHWVDLRTNDYFEGLKEFTKDWYEYRQAMKKRLKERYKSDKKNYKKYILDNWESVKNFIC